MAEATEAWKTWLDKSLTRRNTTLAVLSFPVDVDDRFNEKLDRAAVEIENALTETDGA